MIDGTPTAEGTFNFAVQVIDSSVPAPQIDTQPLSITIALSPGTPDINVKQGATYIPDVTGSYDFGSQDINTDTEVIFTIENTGTADLTFSSINITRTNADLFSITQQLSSPVPPAGGGILSGLTIVTVNAGVATFSGLSIDMAGTGYTLKGHLKPNKLWTCNQRSL